MNKYQNTSNKKTKTINMFFLWYSTETHHKHVNMIFIKLSLFNNCFISRTDNFSVTCMTNFKMNGDNWKEKTLKAEKIYLPFKITRFVSLVIEDYSEKNLLPWEANSCHKELNPMRKQVPTYAIFVNNKNVSYC